MLGRIVEIADDHRHLHAERGFMVIQETIGDRQQLGKIPLDDIYAVITNAHGLSYTNNLLVALAERGAPFVLCSANHNAVGMLISIDGHHHQGRRFDAQLATKKPLIKRLWADVVRTKIEQQSATLQAIGITDPPLASLIPRIRSGDPDNIEAQAARLYWPLLFGEQFRRDRSAEGINVLLNYGYTILRAAVARPVIAAGLHPTIGLHHSNDSNAMRLVDDLMEPFRPMIDLTVWQISKTDDHQLNPRNKRLLVHALYQDMQSTKGATPTLICIQNLATSLALVYLGERSTLELPLVGLPIGLVRNEH